MTEQAELNLEYGSLFADQPKRIENKTKLRNSNTETQNKQGKNESRTNKIFKNKNNVNKIEQSRSTISGQSDISTPNSSGKSTIGNDKNVNEEHFYYCGQPVILWKLLDAETLIRRREVWWIKEMHHPDRTH